MKKLVFAMVLVAVLVSVLAPVCLADGPGGNNQGWWQKAKSAISPNSGQQRAFFKSGSAVRTGVPGIRANDLTSAEGRAAFRAPNLGVSLYRWIDWNRARRDHRRRWL